MTKKSTPLKFSILISCTLLLFASNKTIAQATSLTEGFDNLSTSGWTLINHSSGGGGLTWFQGDSRAFSAFDGNDTMYAAANYQSVSRATGTINNWLISPQISIANGGAITFYTRTKDNSVFPDRLEVRLSTNGSSTNVGTTANDVGDFATVLVSVNPSLDANGYPTGWTQYTANIQSGLGTSGRVAFRYFVTNAGSSGTNSNYIGVDAFSFQSVLPVTLFNFTGLIKDNKAVLTWSTANEINNKGFDVEVSRDNKTFAAVGFVAAVKTSTGINNYSFTDDKILSGSNYYRLKQIDNDGAYRYSTVVKLDLQKFAWTIFNSSSANPWIQLQTKASSNIMVQVVSVNGQVIQNINKGNLAQGTYNIPLNLNSSSHGIYVIRLLVDKDGYTQKVMR